ncbi:CG2046 [Drosophila busckii]|uniref:Proteasome assembly chaperone 1 n=1 Tax=Drosophila busckii TaxID=30019 RepID=A0A0M5J020_DROBS|nr:uncharacterized protein LOC108601786 [Drosophila busckii]ALC46768.1 CG2046 [Drosophila busckii]
MSCPGGFGELNIPSSRAFWDDCEEDEFENIKPAEKLKLQFDAEGDAQELPVESELFVLIEGPQISEFCNNALLTGLKHICGIPSKKSALHWNAAKGQLVASLEEDLSNSGEITELLLPYAQLAKKVLTITIKPKVEYKSEEIDRFSDDVSIVCRIGGNKSDRDVVKLEEPNFIAGVTAGIASWRHQLDLPISSYVIYTDKLPLDAVAAQAVLQLLQKLGVTCSERYVPSSKDSSYLYT